MNRSKPVSLKKLDHKQKTIFIIIIVVCAILLILGWLSTVGGIFKKDAIDAKRQLVESLGVIEGKEDSINVKGQVTKIKSYFQEGVLSVEKRKKAEEEIIKNIKAEIEKN